MSVSKSMSSPYSSMLPAANDQYHAVRAIRQFGVVRHAAALAATLLEAGLARSEREALALAHHEIEHTFRIADGVLVNRDARRKLQMEAAAAGIQPQAQPAR